MLTDDERQRLATPAAAATEPEESH